MSAVIEDGRLVGTDFVWTHLGLGNWASAVIVPKAEELGAKVWGVNFHNADTGALLTAQNNRYHVVEFGPGDHTVVRQVHGLAGVLHAPSQPRVVQSQIAMSDLVTLTVTPNGYEPSGDTLTFLASGLFQRFEMGLAPPVIMSCDNVRTGTNGGRLREAVQIHVAENSLGTVNPEFVRWLDEVAFINTVVDRIVTTPTDDQLVWMSEQSDALAADLRPIVTERLPQHHLIIEMPGDVHDHHLIVKTLAETDTPALLVDDIRPWSSAKSWMMNGTHAVLGMAGQLMDYDFAHEAIADARIRQLVVDFLVEAMPAIDAPDNELGEFASAIISRVSNPRLPDRLSRLTLDIFGKVPRLLDPWLERIQRGEHVSPGRARIMATWALYVHSIRNGSLEVAAGDDKTRNHVLMNGPLDLRNVATVINVLEHAGGRKFSTAQRTVLAGDLSIAMAEVPELLERPDLAPARPAAATLLDFGCTSGDGLGIAAAP